MHATALRLLLRAAMARGEKFHITYTVLPPVVNEVGWHAPPGAGSRTATLTPALSGGGYQCVEWTDVVEGGGGGDGDGDGEGEGNRGEAIEDSKAAKLSEPKPCSDELSAMTLPPPPHWALRVHASRAYPVIDSYHDDEKSKSDDDDEDLSTEVHCVGS